MFPEPLLHVITERNECEPVGATFHLHGDGFAFILESIYAYRIDAKIRHGDSATSQIFSANFQSLYPHNMWTRLTSMSSAKNT